MNSALQKLYDGLQKEIPEAIPENEITLEKIQEQFNKYGGANLEGKNDFTKVSTITSLGMFKTELEKAIKKCKDDIDEKDKIIANGVSDKAALAEKNKEISLKEEENNKLKENNQKCQEELAKHQDELAKQKQEIEAVRNECTLKLEITKSVMQKLCDDASTSSTAEIEKLKKQYTYECELKLAIQKETMNKLYEQNLEAFKATHDTEFNSNKENLENEHKLKITELENECNLKIEIMKATMQKLCDNKVTELSKQITDKDTELKDLKEQIKLTTQLTSTDLEKEKTKAAIQECELKIEITKAAMKSLYDKQISELEEKNKSMEQSSKNLNAELEKRLTDECQLKIDIVKATTAKLCQDRIDSLTQEKDKAFAAKEEAKKAAEDSKTALEAAKKAADEAAKAKVLAEQECTLKIEIIKATMRQLYDKQIEALNASNNNTAADKQQLQDKIKKLEEELLKNRVTDAVICKIDKDNIPQPPEPAPQQQFINKPVNPQIVLIPDTKKTITDSETQ